MSARIKKHNRKTSEMIDEWLDSKGLYRKHTARDGSCLFRAVAEQVFNTQVMHIKVRLSCVRYMGDNKDKFSHLVDGSFDNYLCNLQNPKEWAGQLEMNAMSEMFQRDFLIFREVGSQPCMATNNGFQEKIMLCQSQGHHYDSVYPRDFVVNAAFCQSIVYGILYKVVFQLGDEVELAVEKMLHDKVYAKHRKDSTASHDSACHSPESLPLLLDADLLGSDLKDGASEIRRALAMGIPPFPYKVAKALDPDIYRNVEFDIWNDIRKDEPVFEPGVKCLVRLTDDRSEVYHAHIQEVGNENEPVTVYVEELGVKCDVHYNQLEQLPSPVKKAPWQQIGKSYCAMSVSTCYQKTPVNGMYMDEDVGHQKRKPFKGKIKDYTFPIPIPHHGQGLPPRMQVPREPMIPFGRGRGTMPSPPYNRFKWSQSGSYGHRMHQRTGNYSMNRYSSSGDNFNLSGVGNDQNHHGDDSHPPCDAPNQELNFQAVSSQVTWMKSVQNSSSCPTGTFESGQHALGNGTSSGQIENLDNRAGLMPSTLGPGSTTHDMGSLPDGHLNGSDAHYSNDVYMTQQGQGEPMGYCPYPFMPSLIVPFADATGTTVNYNALRSQDAGGNDLPLLDLPTLRYFYNLGHDYFRMSALVHLPHAATQAPYPSAYTVWQYNSVNDCDANVNAIDSSENSNRDHPVHNIHTIPPMPLPFPVPVPMPMTADGAGAAVMYSRSPFTSPDESGYCTGSPLATELRTSLVLDDQGVLTLSNGADDAAVGGNNGYRPGGQRCRSDSGESTGSWRGVRDLCRSSRQKHAGQRSGSISQQGLQRHEYSPLNGHEHSRSSTPLCTGTNGNGQQQRGYVQLVPNDTVQVPTVAYPPRFGMARSPMAGPFITSPPSLSVSVGYYGPSAGSGTGPPTVPNPATSTPQAVTPMYATTYYSPQPCIYHQPTPQQMPYLPSATHNTQ